MFNIMVVEDEPNISSLMCTLLTQAGYNAIPASDGVEALELLDSQQTDLIVLDVMLPRMDGYEFTEELRAGGDTTPILMVTARQLPEEKCKGFLVGTDDYMVKPFNHEEFLLRVKALLRRAKIANEHKLRIGKIVLDYDALTVTRSGETQTLPQKEFQLLYKLLSYPDRIFTRMQLMDEIWGMDSESGFKTVDVHINRLRKRIEDWPEFEILAIRGIGYKAVIHRED